MDWKHAATINRALAVLLFLCAGYGIAYYFTGGNQDFKILGTSALFLMFASIALRPAKK